MPDLTSAALAYKALGFSVVPVLETKRPPGSWQKYQRIVMSDTEIRNAFTRPNIHGIAVVCGSVSGNFEGFDADCKYDISGTMMKRLGNAIRASQSDLLERFTIASTRNAGYHFYYQSPEVGRSLVLARRLSTPEELILHPDQPVKTLLETRSNGGIIIVPPTDGYKFIQRDLRQIPTINPAERQLLLRTARSFNLYFPDTPAEVRQPDAKNESREGSPFAAYDATDDVIECLQSHDWTLVRRIGPRTYFRRPGHTDKDTSGNFHHELRKFKVFTPNSIFEPEKPYHPYAVFAFLECNKDFDLAAKRLLEKGYGVAYKDRHQ